MATLTRVFISFDYDHDLDLRTLLAGQAKLPDSPFAIADWSLKEASPDWKEKARARIRAADVVAVICGEYTNSAVGVSAEVNIAKSEDKPYFLLKGRANKTCYRPSAALSNKMYKWTWPNLKLLVGGNR